MSSCRMVKNDAAAASWISAPAPFRTSWVSERGQVTCLTHPPTYCPPWHSFLPVPCYCVRTRTFGTTRRKVSAGFWRTRLGRLLMTLALCTSWPTLARQEDTKWTWIRTQWCHLAHSPAAVLYSPDLDPAASVLVLGRFQWTSLDPLGSNYYLLQCLIGWVYWVRAASPSQALCLLVSAQRKMWGSKPDVPWTHLTAPQPLTKHC